MIRTAFFLVVALAACDRPKDDAPPRAPSAPSTSTAPSAASPYKNEDLPVDADFEEEAEKSVDAKNYKQELDALDKAIGDVPDGTAPPDTAD